MTGDFSLFSSFTNKYGGHVTFGDNLHGKILGFRNVVNTLSPSFENVQLVDNLKYNLLSISQLCGKGYRIVFYSYSCKIEDATSNRVMFIGNRNNNVYTIDTAHDHIDEKCFVTLKDDHWL